MNEQQNLEYAASVEANTGITAEQEQSAIRWNNRLGALMDSIPDFEIYGYMTAVSEKIEEVKSRHENFLNVRMYHVLSGSTPDINQHYDAFDFPGGDNIEFFLGELEQKFKPRSKTAGV